LREYLHNDRLQQLLSRLNTIPSVPDLYMQVMRELQQQDPSIQKVAKIIEQDFGMCAKLLHFVNSAHFGLAHQISSPLQAINYVGLNNLRSLILSVEMFSKVDTTKLPTGFSMTRLWQHSLCVGAFARTIARAEKASAKLIDEAYMAGLLHDAGALVLASNMPERYGEVLRQKTATKKPLDEIELQVLGASHAEVGAYLLALWGLPDPIVEAVAFHQRPSLSLTHTFTPLAIIHVADVIASELDENSEDSILDEAYTLELGLMERIPEWRIACKAFVSDSGISAF
jgi:HD-like signal output (HDOD) protein